jgi:predicted Rossmann fold flavoprotein
MPSAVATPKMTGSTDITTHAHHGASSHPRRPLPATDKAATISPSMLRVLRTWTIAANRRDRRLTGCRRFVAKATAPAKAATMANGLDRSIAPGALKARMVVASRLHERNHAPESRLKSPSLTPGQPSTPFDTLWAPQGDRLDSLIVAVIGAGAAGLVAAAFAAAAGAKTILLERTKDGGRKILISGGGRCNVLPSVLAPERFVTDSPPHLLRGMLRSWPLHEQQEFFERDLDIPLALEEESGKLFPRSNRARDVRDGLVAFARSKNVEIQFDTAVTDLAASGAGFSLATSNGDLSCDRVILATGGLSVPTTGSDGIGLGIAERLGHEMVVTYPALTPLLAGGEPHASLSGVSLNVRLRAKTGNKVTEAFGGFLFTHRGYSGPSVLDISHLTARGLPSIRAQWSMLTAAEWNAAFEAPSASVAAILARHVPARLAEHLMKDCGIPGDRRTSSLKRSERLALVDALTAYPLPWTGNEGYKKAEVTGGGVALSAVDARTLESKRVPGLYLCGEILDAFGPIGGHNFSWAWATGRAAGLAAAR